MDCSVCVKLFMISIGFMNFVIATQSQTIKVGIVTQYGYERRQFDRKFWYSNSSSSITLEPVVEYVQLDTLEVTRAVCRLLDTGVHLLISNVPEDYLYIMKGYSWTFRVPLISTSSPVDNKADDSVLYMIPDTTSAVADVMKEYNWTSFVFIYDSDNGPLVLEKVLEAVGHDITVEAFLKVADGRQAFHFLESNRNKTLHQTVLLATETELLNDLLAESEGKRRIFAHFILAKPIIAIHTAGRYDLMGAFSITKFSIGVDTDSILLQEIRNRWHTLIPYSSTASKIPGSALIIKDTSNLVHQAMLHLVDSEPNFNFSLQSLSCLKDKRNSDYYFDVINQHVRKVSIDQSLSGKMSFNSNGERTDFLFDVYEVTSSGQQKMATWMSSSGLQMLKDGNQQPLKGHLENKEESGAVMKKKIVIAVVKDNVLLKPETSKDSTSNRKYEGYIKDLMDQVAQWLNWEYEFLIIGSELETDKPEKLLQRFSDGTLGKDVDLAVGPFPVSPKVDYSKPIITSGFKILHKKPDAGTSFGNGATAVVNVWSYEVWLLLVVAYVVLGGANYFVSNFTGEPDRIRSLDTKLSDRLSPCSSFWYVFGSLNFRGTGIYPRSASHRVLSIIWWCFTLLILMSYIVSLTSQVMNNKYRTNNFVHPKTSDEYLQKFLSEGYPKVLSIKAESLFSYAESGVLADYRLRIADDASLAVETLHEGVEKVRKSGGDYALILDSLIGRNITGSGECDTWLTSGYLTHSAISIIFKKDSDLKSSIDRALIHLEASGDIYRIYEKWFHHTSYCSNSNLNIITSLYSASLPLHEISGAFYFLIVSFLVSTAVAVTEYSLQRKRTTEVK